MQTSSSDKTFHLKWNNHLQNLSQLFTAIYSSSALADVTLSCRDGSIRAHKLVLSACSPYFEQIFRDNPCKHPVIILKGIPYAEINLLVEFMYKGSVDVQEIDLQSLMHTASELEIRGLAYELRKDASSLLNVNLNEYPTSYNSTNVTQENSITSPSADSNRQFARLQQMHLFQESMCKSGQTHVTPTVVENKKKRKSEEFMPATTTTAVKNILAAAAKELAEKKATNVKLKSSLSIHMDNEEMGEKMDINESDNGEVEPQPEPEPEEPPLHGRDTRFKGKKRVSVGIVEEITSIRTPTKSKQGRKNMKVSIKLPTNATSTTADESGDAISKVIITAVTGADGTSQAPPPPPPVGILKCVNFDNLRENRNTKVTVIDDDDSSAIETSDENNLLVETSYGPVSEAQDEEYDSSDSKPFHKGEEKLYKCDLCTLSFTRKFHVKRHRSTHTGERPFQCEDCPYSFNRSSHLTRHRRTHTGERPYRCEACGRTFTRGDKLKLHLRMCEKDEYVLPSHSSNDEKKIPKIESSQTVVSGMVSIGHSERHQLMFTSSGEVILANRPNTDTAADLSVPSVTELNESAQSALLANDGNSPELDLSSTPSTSDTSLLANQFFSLDALGYPMKRGRGRPRKKPIPIDIPLIKKKRGRPPKIIKLDPNDPNPGPVENYNATNLPYGDFSYLTDILSTHFNQTSQAYQNMVQLNPVAANILSNAVSQMQSPIAAKILNLNSTSNDECKNVPTLGIPDKEKLMSIVLAPAADAIVKNDVSVKSVDIKTVKINDQNAVTKDVHVNDCGKENENGVADDGKDSPDEDNCQTTIKEHVPNAKTLDCNDIDNVTNMPQPIGECTVKVVPKDN